MVYTNESRTQSVLECENRDGSLGDRPVTVADLDVSSLLDQPVLRLVLLVDLPRILREAPLVGHDHVLTPRELETSSSESFNGNLLVAVTASHRDDDLADVDTSDNAGRLAKCTAHSGLKSISACA